MWSYYPDLLETPVPRYTSFPTAAEFGPGVGSAEMDAALRETSGDVSLYLHIPFCEKICWYCACNTGAANRHHRLAAYLESLHREIALVGNRIGGRTRVRRIAFGGGSPNAISPTDFVRLADALTLHMDLADPVWSMEADPRTLRPDWRQVLSAVGVRQASLGVQTFAPHLQQIIGRVQPDTQIAASVEILRAAGVTSLNFDLMYGLPRQTLSDLDETLDRTMQLGANRVALFGYAHIPHLIPRQQKIDATGLPSQAERFAMAAHGFTRLTEAGYVPVGFDHFALPDDPLARAVKEKRVRRNFQGFTDDAAPTLIGMGASAISVFPGLLVQNEKNAGRYRMLLSRERMPATLGVLRSPADRALARLIEDLLCQGEARIGRDRAHAMATCLVPFIERGLAKLEGDHLSILTDGLPYARTIAALFDPYRQDSMRRFSSAV